MGLIILIIVTNVLIFKYRGLVHFIMPLMLCYNVLIKMVPSIKNEYSLSFTLQGAFISFLAYYTN